MEKILRRGGCCRNLYAALNNKMSWGSLAEGKKQQRLWEGHPPAASTTRDPKTRIPGIFF